MLAKDVQVGQRIIATKQRVIVTVSEVGNKNGIVSLWYRNPDVWKRGACAEYVDENTEINLPPE